MRKAKLFNDIDDCKSLLKKDPLKKVILDDHIAVCIAWSKERLVAFEALCPHQKAPLHDGKLNAYDEVICPLHAYRFNLQHGNESSHRCRDLKFYSIKIERDGVFIEY
jgi:nitrite reductase/ring-hydroxylating ferredoxin subunit